MKILMLLDSIFPPDVRVEKEARALLNAGHELLLLSMGTNHRPSEEVIDGIKVIRTMVPPSQIILKRAWDLFNFTCTFIDPFWEKALTDAINANKPDVLHVHDLRMLKTGISIAHKSDLRLVIDLHENYPEGLKVWRVGWQGKLINFISPIWRWKQMEKTYLPLADRIVTVVNEAKEHYINDCSVTSGKITVVMNVEDLEYFHSLPINEMKKYTPYFSILYVGGFGIHRGIHTAIQAMPLVLNKITNARLILVGSGGNEVELKRLAIESGVEETVEFCGLQPFDSIPSYISASDICLVPHISSGHTNSTIPHKLFQYMALAKPVIVSSAKPLARIVEETKAGLVYPSGDADALAEAIIKLHDDSELAANTSQAGLKAVKETYNWQFEGNKLIKLYEDMGDI
jgi:glycosyltransferase involved in cell wall biosynthesis